MNSALVFSEGFIWFGVFLCVGFGGFFVGLYHCCLLGGVFMSIIIVLFLFLNSNL